MPASRTVGPVNPKGGAPAAAEGDGGTSDRMELLRRRTRVRMVTSTLLAAVGVLAGLAYVLWPEFTGRPSPDVATFVRRLAGGLCLTVAACAVAALFAWSAIARFIRHQRRTEDQ